MSTPLDNLYHDIPRRDPAVVMRLERMGASHQGRLSFMRILLRRMKAENWRFDIPLFEIDARGVGQAVYSAHGPERSYSLTAFLRPMTSSACRRMSPNKRPVV